MICRHGDERLPPRFWKRVRVQPDGCWAWTGGKNARGYGMYWATATKQAYAHRAAFEALQGSVPAGLQLDHLCRNTNCCNPAHLEAVTQDTNWSRGESPSRVNALKTHCKRGHELTGSNIRTPPPPSKKTARVCIACERIRSAA